VNPKKKRTRMSSIKTPKKEEYDLVILGSGTGSKFLAWTFAEQGQRVVTVERKYIGGACPNIACLPSKNIIHSAKVASYFRRSREFGITVDSFTVNMSGVRDRKRKMVSDLVELHRGNYEKSGAEIIFGSGRFIGPRALEVTLPGGKTRQLRGTNVIISTGTRARLEAIPGLAESHPHACRSARAG
jgi:pyruvate/2-oxoglutarate dehydrogenase complex dihydrolipoamide dehydrogenase (E3) component